LNIARKKGDLLHKRVGLWFLYGMLINGAAGLLMTVIHANYFLFIIAVFSIYLVGTGQRALSLKQLTKGQKPSKIDWILSFSMLVFALGFIGFGGNLIFNKNNFGAVMIVFGTISILMVLKDFRNYNGNSKFKNSWLLTHIQRMVGGYIAATTAFIVVNNTILPSVVAWLLPTVILTPLIFYWSRKFAILKK